MPFNPSISLIAAYAKNRVIGNYGRIPWHIKGEQLRFRDLTMGNAVIMGRRTFEEIGHPLPGRLTIVLSKTKNFDQTACCTAGSLTEAIKLAGTREIYIAGGAEVYQMALPLVQTMYITEIDLEIEGDAYFPTFDETLFIKETVQHIKGEIPYQYITYKRIH